MRRKPTKVRSVGEKRPRNGFFSERTIGQQRQRSYPSQNVNMLIISVRLFVDTHFWVSIVIDLVNQPVFVNTSFITVIFVFACE